MELDDPEFKLWQEQEIFLFSSTRRLALVPTQPPIKWGLGFPPGGKPA